MKGSIRQSLSIFGVMLLGMLLFINACQSDTSETNIPIPVKDMGRLWAEQEAPDDIMTVPGGGPAYRANVQQQGVENPWSKIDVAEVILGSGSSEVWIYYRDYVETKAGETRNNVIKAIMPNGVVGNLSLYASDITDGITLTDGMQWSGPGTKASVLVIEINTDVEPGQYTFKLGFEINSEDYGTAPCTIEVIE